ncbi:post-segregation antitoxin CcdA [Sphingomonas panacisoli]|uniref:Post-segregation antitoxin CcdA n=2 Tax=Sphingomonas panacisoli TaxID=1813879 RepID=A0A5B8LII7_9SPHN|nr:type II toxin-antitoxin system CcdA family antitoxin [Sphingomonas panacisoli]QDZ07414.1 post-segregation antitoxin CcdA [Sphingomonas panacisoli]
MPSLRENRSPFRRPTNVSLDAKLVEEAKELGINVSRASEEGVAREVKAERERRFREENREAFEDWNKYVEENGLPLERFRHF